MSSVIAPAFLCLEDTLRPIPGQTVVETLLTRHLQDVPWPEGLEASAPVAVILEHGRWIVRCPDCPSAQLASWDDRRFYCSTRDCPHPLGRAWRPVVWPEAWAAIESAVSRRAAVEHRNWQPGETVEDLRAENAAHPDGLLDPVAEEVV